MSTTPSRRKLLTFGLAGLCTALTVLTFLPPPEAPPPESPGQVNVAALGGDTATEPVVAARSTDSPAFQRPIFVPSRRMPDQAGDGQARATSVDGMKLTAVFLGPGTEKALVTTGGAGSSHWVSPGETLGGWRIEAVQPESLVLVGPGGRREIMLEKPEAAPPSRAPLKMRRARVPNPPPAEQERGAQAAPEEESAPDEGAPD